MRTRSEPFDISQQSQFGRRSRGRVQATSTEIVCQPRAPSGAGGLRSSVWVSPLPSVALTWITCWPLVGPAEGGECGPLPFRVIDDRDDLPRGQNHGPLDLGFLLGRIGHAGFEGEASRTEERLLDVDPTEEAVTELPDDRQGLPPDPTTKHEYGDAGMSGEVRGQTEAVGDDRQLAPAAARLELSSDGQGCRARIHDDAVPVLDESRAGRADPEFLFRLEAFPDLKRQLGAAAIGGDRTTMGPDQSVLTFQGQQVLADRDRRHAELRSKIRNEHPAVLLDHPRDLLLPLAGEHMARGGAG